MKPNSAVVVLGDKTCFITSDLVADTLSACERGNATASDIARFVDRSNLSIHRYLKGLVEASLLKQLPVHDIASNTDTFHHWVAHDYTLHRVMRISETPKGLGSPRDTDVLIKFGGEYLTVSQEVMRLISLIRLKQGVTALECINKSIGIHRVSRALGRLYRYGICQRKQSRGGKVYYFGIKRPYAVVPNAKVIMSSTTPHQTSVRPLRKPTNV